MTIIEIIAVIFGLACVWLTIRQNIWCWPTGLIQVALFIVIFYQVKLYSDMGLHIIYVFMQIYGWHHWLHGGRDKGLLPVSSLPGYGHIMWWSITVVGSILLGFLMNRFTDAAVPYGDAFTTVASLVAQWLLARKRLESWIFWITVDVVAIGIYWYKGLVFTTGLYAVFLVLACSGFYVWRRNIKPLPAS